MHPHQTVPPEIVPPRLYLRDCTSNTAPDCTSQEGVSQAAFTGSNITHTHHSPSRCACPPLIPTDVQEKRKEKGSPVPRTENPINSFRALKIYRRPLGGYVWGEAPPPPPIPAPQAAKKHANNSNSMPRLPVFALLRTSTPPTHHKKKHNTHKIGGVFAGLIQFLRESGRFQDVAPIFPHILRAPRPGPVHSRQVKSVSVHERHRLFSGNPHRVSRNSATPTTFGGGYTAIGHLFRGT